MAASDLCKAVNAMREPDIPAEIVRCRNIGDLCLVFWEKYDCESTTSVFAFKTSSPGTIFVGRTDDLKASSLAYDVESWKLLKPPQSESVGSPTVLLAGGSLNGRGFFNDVSHVIPLCYQTYRLTTLDVHTQWRLFEREVTGL